MSEYRFTAYFEQEVLRKRSYLWRDPQRLPRPRVHPMKVNYHPDSDSLYIDLSERSSVESREVSAGVVLDYDAAGDLVGIDIDNASRKVQLERLVLTRMTSQIERIAG